MSVPEAQSQGNASDEHRLRNVLLRSAAQMASAIFVLQAAGLVRAYLGARVLGPKVYGMWLGLRLIVDYGATLHLGVVFGMHRNVPLLRGRGEEGGVAEVKQTSFSFVLLMGGVGAILVAAVAAALPSVRGSLLAIAAVLFVNLIKSHYVTLFRADNRFREGSIGSILGSLVSLTTLPLIWVAGLPGFIWGMAAQAVVEVGYLMARSEMPALRIDRRVLRELLGIGLLTMLISLATVLLTSVDRSVILKVLDEEHLGWYGIAFLVATFLNGIAVIPNSVLYPRLSERFGRTGNPSDLAPLVRGPIRSMSVVYSTLIGIGALSLPALVPRLLPKYVAGISAAQVAMFGTYSFVIVGLAGNCFFALNRQWLYLGVQLVATAASYAFALAAVRLHRDLVAVAVGVSLGLLVLMVAAVPGAFHIMGLPLRDGLAALAQAVVPIAVAGGAVLAIELVLRPLLPPASIARAAIGELCFLALATPFLWRIARQIGR